MNTKEQQIKEIGAILKAEQAAYTEEYTDKRKVFYARIAELDAEFNAAYDAASKKAQDAWLAL